uniref:Uncharacterized protein n=1 Tax=Arundo donax TaxID=35708 RepID=A0A0A9FF94_ARUDO
MVIMLSSVFFCLPLQRTGKYLVLCINQCTCSMWN